MILLTGGTGFVGRHLAVELASKPYKTLCLARDPRRVSALPGNSVSFVQGDVTVPSSLPRALKEIDTVIHLVGILVESKGSTYRRVHVEGTRNVVEACLKAGIRRYIHVSALGARKDAASEYHRTKWEAEEIVRASGLDYTIFRPSVIFGEGDRFTNTFASAMRLSPFVIVPGDGKNRMQPVFVKDVARALSESVVMEATKGRTYEIAGPLALSFDEIIDAISGAIGKKRLRFHAPMSFMRICAAIMERILSHPPLTRDALLMLKEDNVTDKNGLPDVFGIKPTGLAEGMSTYLH
ncbi:MAG: complex I NDUFA9 subunit family protein [Deltaproteobacteria bacterium]|nr:complex I NDUFA9 subunit family protein [Deltaproteobacteria bacterium]